MPKAISLFSGCGGADLGLLENGFDVVFANDVWGVAHDLYKANLPATDLVQADIACVSRFPAAELLVGCYPCQGYSQAGARDPTSNVNYLYREFDRVLRRVRPKAFVVENVGGMVYGANRKLLSNQLVRFRAAGYAVSWSVLDAADYGLPQTRRRIFIVGIQSQLGIKYAFPPPTHGPKSPQPHKGQQEAIGGMPEWPEGEFCRDPFHWYYLSRRRRHDWGEPSACIVGHWRHVPLHPMSPSLVRIDTDHWVFSSNGPARRLSLRECAALQGFPESYRWDGPRLRDAFLAVGNAVPRPLIGSILGALPDIW